LINTNVDDDGGGVTSVGDDEMESI